MNIDYAPLLPDLEQRLQAWAALEEKRKTLLPPKPRPTITLSREFGCEAYPLAERLKTRCEETFGESWSIYDQALIDKVSQDQKIAPHFFENFSPSLKILELLPFLSSAPVTQREACQLLARAILHLATHGNAIIIGRGGAVITQAKANCYHFRLEADLPFRIASIRTRMNLSLEKAAAYVKEQETRRDLFLQSFLGRAVDHLADYSAIFNNAKHGVPQIAEAIVAYIKSARDEQVSV